MGSDRIRQFLVVFSVIGLIVMNYLSNTGMFGGQTNGEVSDKYHTLITPAGYAFSIWGLIFLGLLAFAVFQALPTQRMNPRFRAVGWLVILNGFCNAIWSPLFNNERIGLALIVILVMLLSLVIIEQRLLARPNSPLFPVDPDMTLPEVASSATETWMARIPFSIYFGWLTIATILNVAVYLKAANFGLLGLSEQTWAIAVLIIGLLVGAVIFNRFRSVAYMLVFTWAYAAIAVEQSNSVYVKLVALAGAFIALVLAVVGLTSRKTPAYT